MNNKIKMTKIAFWGSSQFSIYVLDELYKNGVSPKLLVTATDKPKGRKLVITAPITKDWAIKKNIEVIQTDHPKEIESRLKEFDLFIVASFGKIIPQKIIEMPRLKTLNVHPSLLPKYRGATPIQTTILNGDKTTGVTIMLMDDKVDHGPILSQKKYEIKDGEKYSDLERVLGILGGELLLETIEPWAKGEIKPQPQNHSLATYTKKIEKEDGFFSKEELADPINAEKIYRKIKAFNNNPPVFSKLNIGGEEVRINITQARIENKTLVIEKIVPAGKKEMSWGDFIRTH